MAFATAIGAAIVGDHRRHDRVGRHHQRPQGAAGPPSRRGRRFRDPVPAARPRRDPHVAQRPGRRHHRPQGRPGDVELQRRAARDCPPATPTPTSTGCATGCARWRSAVPEPMSVAVGATYDATIADTNNLHRRVMLICSFAIVRRGRAGLAAGRVRGAPAQTAGPAGHARSTPATRRPTSRSAAPPRPSRSPRRCDGMLQRIWKEQDRTKDALASARDFAAVSVARTAHAADRDAHQPRGAGHPGSAG